MKKIKQLTILQILLGLYILFISLFSWDTEPGVGFLIHLLPSIIFITTLIFTWIKPKVAGAGFILEGLGTIIVFNTYRDLFVLSVVSIIPVILGILLLFIKNPKH